MVNEAEVKVKLKAEGAEETKARLLETRAAVIGVSSEQLKNAQAQRQAARDAQVLNNAESFKTRIFLAQHPALNQVTRGLKDMATFGRSALAITTAISTAYTAFGRVNVEAVQLQAQIAQKQRELAIELAKAIPDEEKIANLKGDLNALNAEMDANKQAAQQGFLSNIALIGGIFASAAGGIATALPKIAAATPPLQFLKFLFGDLIAKVPVAAAVLAGFFAGTWLRENVLPDSFKKPIDDFFFKSIPEAVRAGIDAFLGFGNKLPDIWATIQSGFMSFWNGMVNTVTKAVNTIITSVQSAIDWIARLPSTIGGGIVNGISGGLGALIQQQRHGPQNARAGGGMITEPVMGIGLNSGQTWTFGEAGPEMVVPMGGFRGGGGGGNTLIINYNNSTFTGDMAFRRSVDNAVKETLKRHGW